MSAASEDTPSSTFSLQTAATISRGHKILIAVGVSALFFTCLLFMAYYKCLGFKIRKKVMNEEEGECEVTKANIIYPLDLSQKACSKDVDENSLKRFSWQETEKLTQNFSSVIGEGGFSTVYLARFSDSSLGALKIHNNSERLSRVFKQELEVLRQVRHENIVKLLGYCDEREEGALVFEYVPRGSLHDKLHNQSGRDQLLTWNHRMSIAFQLAQAVEYLHDNCALQIIHCDIKASNILLDEQLNCKLCDFGFAKMGFSSTVLPSSANPVMGSPGYVDPHYMRTGLISKKNDVYSFGVLVLELITGIEAFCEERQKLLTSLADPILRDSTKVTEMMDSNLAGEFNTEEAIAMVSIASLCIQGQPSLRPSMADILQTMREKIPSMSFLDGRSKEIANT